MTTETAKDKIIFFGSGPVAAKSLEYLANIFEIEVVITKPKPEHHHGTFPVIDLSKKLGLTIMTITNKLELDELFLSLSFDSKAAILIDFGIIVSQQVIDYFPVGIINSHFSILPEWRGADPITFSILSGQKTTGVSLMMLTSGLDEGPIIATSELAISSTETSATLTEKLINLSNRMIQDSLLNCLDMIEAIDQLTRGRPDTKYVTTYSKKIAKSDGEIDWNKNAQQIEREIRAYSEWPKCFTTLGSVKVIINSASTDVDIDPTLYDQILQLTPGEITVNEGRIIVSCGSSTYLQIISLKPIGKNEMKASEFLKGYGQKIKQQTTR